MLKQIYQKAAATFPWHCQWLRWPNGYPNSYFEAFTTWVAGVPEKLIEGSLMKVDNEAVASGILGKPLQFRVSGQPYSIVRRDPAPRLSSPPRENNLQFEGPFYVGGCDTEPVYFYLEIYSTSPAQTTVTLLNPEDLNGLVFNPTDRSVFGQLGGCKDILLRFKLQTPTNEAYGQTRILKVRPD